MRTCSNKISKELYENAHEAIREIWINWGLGNDYYYTDWSINDLIEEEKEGEISTAALVEYIRATGEIENDDERFLIHNWW